MKRKPPPSPPPQTEPEAPEDHPTSTFAEARRRARSILGLDEGEARIKVEPPVVAKVVTRDGKRVLKWHHEAGAKKRGDWSNDHPLEAAAKSSEKKHTAEVNKIVRQERLRQDQQKGVDRNRAKGQASAAQVCDLADQRRIADMGRNMAAHIAKVTGLSASQVRRILADRKARMTEK